MDKMEVLKLVAHLVITLVLIVGYLLLILTKNEHDVMFQGAIMAVIGYWFGAIVPKNKGGGGE